MTNGPGKRNPKGMQRKILAAAGEVLAEAGLSGFGVNAVAERAGCGKPLVYRYFGGRQQLLDALAHSKAEEIRGKLADQKGSPPGNLSVTAFKQIQFARLFAADPVLRAVYRTQLCGELGTAPSAALEGIVPMSGKKGEAGAAEAFLVAGINYVLMLRDNQATCLGAPIATPSDLAVFERAFVALSSRKG